MAAKALSVATTSRIPARCEFNMWPALQLLFGKVLSKFQSMHLWVGLKVEFGQWIEERWPWDRFKVNFSPGGAGAELTGGSLVEAKVTAGICPSLANLSRFLDINTSATAEWVTPGGHRTVAKNSSKGCRGCRQVPHIPDINTNAAAERIAPSDHRAICRGKGTYGYDAWIVVYIQSSRNTHCI